MTVDGATEELRGELRDELARALGRLPELAGATLSFTALSGGITNRNFLVEEGPGRGRLDLRLKKGYRVWSSDVTPEETPYEAGLRFAVKPDKGTDFTGRAAYEAARAAGPRKRLRCLVLDDARSVALGNEPVRVGGSIVGRVTSGGYGIGVERSTAYAYLPPDPAAIGSRGEVEVFGEWIGFEIAREPLWDPDGSRIRS